MVTIILILIIIINIVGFSMAGIDKQRSIKRMWRIPEKNFYFVSIIGGCPGVYLGFIVFRHKTKHLKFMLGLPFIFVIQLIILFYAFNTYMP